MTLCGQRSSACGRQRPEMVLRRLNGADGVDPVEGHDGIVACHSPIAGEAPRLVGGGPRADDERCQRSQRALLLRLEERGDELGRGHEAAKGERGGSANEACIDDSGLIVRGSA